MTPTRLYFMLIPRTEDPSTHGNPTARTSLRTQPFATVRTEMAIERWSSLSSSLRFHCVTASNMVVRVTQAACRQEGRQGQ